MQGSFVKALSCGGACNLLCMVHPYWKKKLRGCQWRNNTETDAQYLSILPCVCNLRYRLDYRGCVLFLLTNNTRTANLQIGSRKNGCSINILSYLLSQHWQATPTVCQLMLDSTPPRSQLVCHCTDGIDMQFQPELTFQNKHIKHTQLLSPQERWKCVCVFVVCCLATQISKTHIS